MLWFKKMRFSSIILMVLLCFMVAFAAVHHALHAKIIKKERITSQITQHLKNENSTMEDSRAKRIASALYEESNHYGLDYRLVLALMKIESNFQHDAVSSQGARGLLQVKPSLAKFIAKDLGIKWDGHRTLDEPGMNIKIGICFLSQLMGDFQNINLALKAYNMGPSKVKEFPQDNANSAKGFPGLVMNEYKKNVSVFPNP
jgi:soluble lytic murein transglycosylase